MISSTPTPQPRPLTSSRLRRRSNNPTPSHSSPLASTTLSNAQDGFMGGLREEDELKGANREELESALMGEWVDREEMLAKLVELQEYNKKLTKSATEKENMIASLSSRLDNGNDEQTRLEEALASREAVLDKLRTAVKDMERERKEIDRRYNEQERSFETERQAFALTEQHLRSSLMVTQNKLKDATEDMRNKRVGSESTTEELAATPINLPTTEHPTQPLTLVSEELSEAQSEISHLRTTNASLQAQDKAMTRELHLLKEDYEKLRDQNESYEMLLRERTMEGGMMFDEEPGDSAVGGMDRIGEEAEDRQTMDALISENKALKDSNKALSLYCSKILDRIISQEGFEHILSTDYKDSTSGRRGSPATRRTKESARLPLSAVIEPQTPTPAAASPAAQIPAADSKRRSIMRPLSMLIPSMRPSTPPHAQAAEQSPSEKRARRGMSIDWRSFGGFGSSSSPLSATPLQIPSADRPISAPPPSIPQPKLDATTASPRITYYEEDEDDRRERDRLTTTMKLVGIDTPSCSVPTAASRGSEDLLTPAPSTSLQRSTSRSSTISTPSVTSPPPSRSSTPLSRFSSFLGKTGLIPSSPLSPEIEKLDPTQEVTDDVAAAALKAFDDREKQQLARLSKGSAGGSFTSPSPELVNGIALRRRASANQARSPSKSATSSDTSSIGGHQERTGHANKSSVSTLWSFGEDEAVARGGSPEPMPEVGGMPSRAPHL